MCSTPSSSRSSSRGSTVGKFTIKFRALHAAKISDNARTAIQDTTTIAYLGEVAPGASADSIGITNAPGPAPGQPDRHRDRAHADDRRRPRRAQQLLRVAEDLRPHVRAGGAEHRGRGQGAGAGDAVARRHTACTSPTTAAAYGRAIALAVRNAAGPRSRSARARSAPTPCSTARPRRARRSACSERRRERTRRSSCSRPPRSTRARSRRHSAAPGAPVHLLPGFLPEEPDAERPEVRSRLHGGLRPRPRDEAIFGYEAMAAVLDVLREAGASANNRTTVVHDFFGIQQPRLGARDLLDQCQRRHEPGAVRVQPLQPRQLRAVHVRASHGVSDVARSP